MPTAVTYTQDTFSGGLNLLSLDTAIPANQYFLGINVRTRFGYVKPVRSPVEIREGLPATFSHQGLYSFGSLLILFASGLAYYRINSAAMWTPIAGFAMSDTADRLFCCAVPEASLKYLRVAPSTDPSADIDLTAAVTTTNAVALVVQDGINQPFLIFSDGTCRVSKTYAQWTTVDREYVPIGRQMCYFSGILFIVDAAGKNIYRSVSGRPLDFVVAIDAAGDKVADATAVSFAVDANQINLFTQLNADSLVVITAYTAYSVILDFDKTLYGEPTFKQTLLFTAGVVNQFSFADILGDFAFVDKEGLKSFNAVSQLKFEGNNGVFSLSVAALFKNIVQTDPCVGSFDNYTFFGVKTAYSSSTILVYDNIQKVFPSLDIFLPRPIRQFAATYTDSQQRFFVATTNSVYELYSEAAPTFEPATFFTRAFDTRNCDILPNPQIGEIRTTGMRMIFEDAVDAGGRVQITEVVDGRIIGSSDARNITQLSYSVPYPVDGPLLATVTNAMSNLMIPLKGKKGDKVSFILLWTKGARLNNFQILVDTTLPTSSVGQQQKVYAS